MLRLLAVHPSQQAHLILRPIRRANRAHQAAVQAAAQAAAQARLIQQVIRQVPVQQALQDLAPRERRVRLHLRQCLNTLNPLQTRTRLRPGGRRERLRIKALLNFAF